MGPACPGHLKKKKKKISWLNSTYIIDDWYYQLQALADEKQFKQNKIEKKSSLGYIVLQKLIETKKHNYASLEFCSDKGHLIQASDITID